MKKYSIITIHPKFCANYLAFGVMRAAMEKGLAAIDVIDLRDFAVDKHASVDDAPYGGGDGMVLRPEPLRDAVAKVSASGEKPLVIVTSPSGKKWTQAEAESLAAMERPIVFVCGRFGGIDQRFLDKYVDRDYSLGDFVVSGGELPVLAMLDGMLRLIPGVLGNVASAQNDSFASGMKGLLEHPLYTRPMEFEGDKVPDVLMSGDHRAIAAWREDQAKKRTKRLRPDLL